MRLLVHEPMKTRSSANSVIGVPGVRFIYSRALAALLRSLSLASSAGLGIFAPIGATCPGFVPQVTCGITSSARKIFTQSYFAPGSLGSCRQRATAASKSAGANSRPRRYAIRGFVRGDHAGPSPRFDRHVADGHPLFHGQGSNRLAGVLDAIARAAVRGELTDEIQDQILGRDARRQFAIDANLHRLGQRLQQGLRGQHMFDFAGADAKGQRPERAVRGRVAVAADDRHAGLGQSQLGSDHVYDSLLAVPQVVQFDAEFLAVFAQRVDLLLRNHIQNWQRAVGRGDVMIGRGDGQFWSPHLASRESQTLEGLGAGDLVDQVSVDVQDGLLPLFGMQ